MEPKQHLKACALAALVLFATAAANAADLSTYALYAAITNTQSYSTFVGPIPIDGLTLDLPAATASYNTAIVTLSMPNLYLTTPTSVTDTMAAQIELVAPFAPGGLTSANGGIGCDSPKVTYSAKKPITIVLKVPLGSTVQPVEAEWSSTNGTVITDVFSSISAVLVRE